ncbi:hypothetical protein [Paenibacillus soyae]|uniref:Uncharacterized protein n=1 Tax=Paenibacillus soyae TaxID=2969249 RepID=A0A9X2MQ11_9BACL|nr:hypothetical protein [Paenibacillus soyae]MCR2804104.1 hypothetical protein [Paenibacillus soyae]
MKAFRFRNFAAALLLLFGLIPSPFVSAKSEGSAGEAELSVKASPNAAYATKQSMPIAALFKGAVTVDDASLPSTDTYLTVTGKSGGATVYRVDPDGNLHLEDGKELILKPAARQKLLAASQELRARHYGELLPWEEARTVIPRKAKLKVIDLESGLSFNAQRRAGSSHADVQPLTKGDTDIMKQIYNGKWSWHRRAILVEANGRTLAASMHGMPHGGDGIPNNGFSGHFCIHFLGSATHGKGNIDLGHQFMVAKAAGALDAFKRKLDPYDMINAFFLANEYGDSQLMEELFSNAGHEQAHMRHFGAERGTVRHRFMEENAAFETMVAVDIPVETCLIRGGACRDQARSVFRMRRMSPAEQWRIDGIEQ